MKPIFQISVVTTCFELFGCVKLINILYDQLMTALVFQHFFCLPIFTHIPLCNIGTLEDTYSDLCTVLATLSAYTSEAELRIIYTYFHLYLQLLC